MGQMKGEEELREKTEAEAGQNEEQAEKYFQQECDDKLRGEGRGNKGEGLQYIRVLFK